MPFFETQCICSDTPTLQTDLRTGGRTDNLPHSIVR